MKHNKQETGIQAEDDDPEEDNSCTLLRAESILNVFNRLIGRFFYFPSKPSRVCESIRKSRKSFRLNDPEAFNESLTQMRTCVSSRAILPPLSQKLILNSDDEEEMYYFPEKIVKVYTDSAGTKEELMRVHIDNEPTQRIVQREESEWKILRRGGEEKVHFTGDNCRLCDPSVRGTQILTSRKLTTERAAFPKKKTEIVDSKNQLQRKNEC